MRLDYTFQDSDPGDALKKLLSSCSEHDVPAHPVPLKLPSRSKDMHGSLDAFEIVDIVGLLELLRMTEFCITHVGLHSPFFVLQQMI